jgi:hypothetical protein
MPRQQVGGVQNAAGKTSAARRNGHRARFEKAMESAPSQASSNFKYWAFISYSHADARWGDWLHRKLESYRVPRSLIGKSRADGAIPRRISPIFRDREELSASADLGANLKRSLEQSRYLIVICSPKSAQSRWVNEEVRHFKGRHGEEKVLCFIVAGSPNALDKSGAEHLNCFPPAVRYRLLADGSVSTERTSPIAADARPQCDGPNRAKFKLLAGLLGVNFDVLWRRERRRWVRQVVHSVISILLATALAWKAWEFESTEQARRMSITQFINEGMQELAAGQRLAASFYFAKARRAGGKGTALDQLQRETAKALIQPVAVLRSGHNGWISSACFLDDGHVVTSSWDKTVRLWNVKSGESQLLVTEMADVQSVNFCPGRNQFATATRDGACNLRARNGTLLARFDHGPGHRVNWADFAPDGQRLVTACDDWMARIWNLSSPAKPLLLSGHQNPVKTAAFDAQGARVLTSSFDATAKIWDAATGTCLATLPHSGAVNAAAFSPDGKYVAAGCLDGTMALWDAAKQSKMQTYTGRSGARINSVTFSADGSRLLSASDDCTAKIWDVFTGELLLSYEQHAEAVLDAAFNLDGSRVVTAGRDKTAAIFAAKVEPRTIDEITSLAEKMAASRSADGSRSR